MVVAPTGSCSRESRDKLYWPRRIRSAGKALLGDKTGHIVVGTPKFGRDETWILETACLTIAGTNDKCTGGVVVGFTTLL
jgi:hypothetical protein